MSLQTVPGLIAGPTMGRVPIAIFVAVELAALLALLAFAFTY